VWTPTQARRFFAYTKSLGGRIAAAEFMNEPNFASFGGTPPGYDAAAYGRDFKVFRSFAREAAPDMVILGPGSVGERASGGLGSGTIRTLKTRDLLAATGPGVDAFSYHHYGTVSKRCAGGNVPMTTPEDALSEEWLARTDASLAFYRSLRDEFEPGKPLWLTETADAACGGNPWASSFTDTFRYLDQLGRTGEARRPGRRPQHARRQRLRHARRARLHTQAQLLGGAPVAPAHGIDRPRFGGAGSRRAACLCALLARQAGRRRAPPHQHGPRGRADGHASVRQASATR
jgi:hypothetical protein